MSAATAGAVRTRPAETRRRRAPGVGGRVALWIWGIAGLAFLFLPVLTIVVYSFNTGRDLQIFQSFGFEAFGRALGNPVILAAVQVSLIVSAGSAIVSTILGTFAGIALGRRPGKWAPPLLVVLGLVLVTPDIVNALSLLPWFVSLGVDVHLGIFNSGYTRLIVADSLFAATLVTFVVRSRVAGMDDALEEAAADLYAPPITRFFTVTLPVIRPAVISGALLAFTVSLDETVVASFVSVAGTTPWPVYIFAATRSALRPEVAAMSTLVLILTLAALAIIVLVLRRSSSGSGGGTAQLARDLVG